MRGGKWRGAGLVDDDGVLSVIGGGQCRNCVGDRRFGRGISEQPTTIGSDDSDEGTDERGDRRSNGRFS